MTSRTALDSSALDVTLGELLARNLQSPLALRGVALRLRARHLRALALGIRGVRAVGSVVAVQELRELAGGGRQSFSRCVERSGQDDPPSVGDPKARSAMTVRRWLRRSPRDPPRVARRDAWMDRNRSLAFPARLPVCKRSVAGSGAAA